MTELVIPKTEERHTETGSIERYLAARGILYKHFDQLENFQDADDEELIASNRPLAEPHLEINSLDILRVGEETPNLEQLKDAFNKEHTHSEDEIRLLLQGAGTFWIHVSGEVFGLRIVGGDLIKLPAGTKHWFTFENPPLVALRFFTTREGWEADFTHSGIEHGYSLLTESPISGRTGV